MANRYEKEMMITIGMCDSTGRLGIPNCFEQCMNIATEHAAALGVGITDLATRRLFWLAVRTRIVFHSMPAIESAVTMETWPEAPQRLRCNRSYRMTQGDIPVFEGRTEWTLLNTDTGALIRGDAVYPDTMAFDVPPVFDTPFARVRDDFDAIPPYAEYTVRSTDIDLGGHMNNTAYIRALCGSFSTAELAGFPIGVLDVRYVSPALEGETIRFRRRDLNHVTEIRAAADGRTVLLAAAVRRD